MSEEVVALEETNDDGREDRKELYLFKKSFILFTIGVSFLVLSTLNYATSINGVPRFFRMFSFFAFVSCFFYFISFFMIRKLHNSFTNAYITVAIYLVVLLFGMVCETSNRPYFVELSRGLVWSANLLEIFYYILFFYGCSKLFEKHEFRKGRINAKLSYVIFASLSVLEALFTYLSKTRFVMRDIFFNRFFLYGSWGIQFLLYTFIFVISIMAAKYIQRKIFRMEEREKASLTENEKVSD